MANPDIAQAFLLENLHVRGELVHLQKSFTTAMQQHHYPPVIRTLLGEVLVASVLLARVFDFEGHLTLQLQSDGPIQMLVAKCDHELNVRGLAQWDPEVDTHQLSQAIGEGQLIITLQSDNDAEPYQSIVSLHHRSMAAALRDYFAQTGQSETMFWFSVDQHNATAMMIQKVAQEEGSQANNDDWQHALKLAETLTDKELLELDNETILHRLYHQEVVRVFDEQPVAFYCNCSVPRMQQAVLTLGEEEINSILEEEQWVVVSCEYCGDEYSFGRDEIEAIFLSGRKDESLH